MYAKRTVETKNNETRTNSNKQDKERAGNRNELSFLADSQESLIYTCTVTLYQTIK